MGRRKVQEFEDTVPPASDPCWKNDTKPLLNFLARPRSFNQMEDWAREQGHSRSYCWHLLAWLHMNRLAMYDHLTDKWCRPDQIAGVTEP